PSASRAPARIGNRTCDGYPSAWKKRFVPSKPLPPNHPKSFCVPCPISSEPTTIRRRNSPTLIARPPSIDLSRRPIIVPRRPPFHAPRECVGHEDRVWVRRMEDIAIIGGGSAGEAAAIEAARAGAHVTVIERERVGGACPFVACM